MSQSNDPILIEHTSSGASATLYPFGATLASYINASGHETLFVSTLAKTDGSKALRGGIPLVFPQFGQPNKDMPQHGFLRNNYWKIVEPVVDEAEGATATLGLELGNVVNGRGDGSWAAENAPKENLDCSIHLKVLVTASACTTTLAITNAGSVPFDYQTLFHTYYKIYGSKALDPTCCNVTGLGGYSVEDKITGETYVQDSSTTIVVDKEVDRIYTPPSDQPEVKVVISTGEDGSKVYVKASGKAGDVALPVSAVIWNPFIEKAKGMSDFGNEDYHDMICVEPGILSGVDALGIKDTVVFEQVISTQEF